jgi:hypothetical protein
MLKSWENPFAASEPNKTHMFQPVLISLLKAMVGESKVYFRFLVFTMPISLEFPVSKMLTLTYRKAF